MNLPNCGIKCPLKRFYEVYKDVIPTEDFDIECSLPTASEELNYTSWNGEIKRTIYFISPYFKSRSISIMPIN